MTRRIILVDIGNALMLSGVLPSVSLNADYSARLSARGGRAPYTYTIVAGTLPDGLQLDPATGIVAGAASAAGTFAITVRATDTSGRSVQRSYAITVIAEPLVLTLTGTFADATVGTPYSSDLTITNGLAPYTLHGGTGVTAGALPAGLALSIVGDKLRLSGTPTTASTGSFTAAVDSSDGQTATASQVVTASVVVGFVTLDPASAYSADSRTTINLSNSNLTAHGSGTIVSGAGVECTAPRSSGRPYWEVHIDAQSPAPERMQLGIKSDPADICAASPTVLGQKQGEVGTYGDGSALVSRYREADNRNGLPASTVQGAKLSPWPTNAVVRLRFDIDVGLLERAINNGPWELVASGIPVRAWYAAHSQYYGSFYAQQVTFNFGATAFAYPVPEGYEAGWHG